MSESKKGASPKCWYFYTDPLAAAWMQKHYGMRFLTPHGDELRWFDGKMMFGKPYPLEGSVLEGKTLLIESLDPHYIHPDSLHLLEPRAGDLVSITGYISDPATISTIYARIVRVDDDGGIVADDWDGHESIFGSSGFPVATICGIISTHKNSAGVGPRTRGASPTP
jgi:hypothetical protein